VKKKIWIVVMLFFAVPCFVTAQDPVAEETGAEIALESPNSSSNEGSFGKGVWAFLNSSVGVSVVIFILSFVLGKIFTHKPKWKNIVLKYGPSLMQAVKMAEKKIPDDTDSKGKARLDAALKYVIELEPKLKESESLKKALATVHANAESHGNLKKE
jgi:hypothetical protein